MSKDFYTNEEICNIFGIMNINSFYDYIIEIPGEFKNKLINRYKQVICKNLNKELNKYSLHLNIINDEYYIDSNNWDISAKEIINIVNADGMFYIEDINDFIRICGTNCIKNAVKSHIHWISEEHRIYGGTSLKDKINKLICDLVSDF